MREYLRSLVNSFKSNPREMLVELMIVTVVATLTAWTVWYVFAGDAPDPEYLDTTLIYQRFYSIVRERPAGLRPPV